jgi:hypothetical protein
VDLGQRLLLVEQQLGEPVGQLGVHGPVHHQVVGDGHDLDRLVDAVVAAGLDISAEM